ncbi:MAG TPA: TIGR03943 family protein [Streptosporangiaceae bacterium]
MSEDARATTVLLVGVLLVRLSLTHAYARYVRVGMGWWLLVAGILLVVLGLAGVVRALTRRDEHQSEPAGHHHGSGVGWLLLAPVLALLLVTPPALGSFGVDRNATVDVTSGGRTFPSLPAGRTVPMSLLEFDQRAADHDGASMGTTAIRLTGFVARTADGSGFRLARYQIACCAADAVAAVVRVVGAAGDPPPRDRWVTVTGTFHGSAGDIPELQASSLTEIPAPADPYE